jgi:HSP20 family protein
MFTKEQESIKIRGRKPPVNIIEFADYYHVEMPAPGFQKEDFFIKTHGSSLLIIGYKRSSIAGKEGHFLLQGFQGRYITRSIDVPADADTEFGTAEYKNGVLYIYLYRSDFPVQNHQNFIIVY